MAILVLQHCDSCRPGRLGLTLRDHAFKLDIRRIDRGEPLPPDFDDVDGVISLGGPQHVGGPEKWLAAEMAFLKEAHDRSLPIVGICLGHQLLAAALGGEVTKMDKPEIGMHPVDITVPGQTDTILSGIAWRSWQFQTHSWEVKTPPPGAAVLASSAQCKVQCFRAGLRSYGFQYHFEADRPMIEALAKESPGEMVAAGLTAELLRQQLDQRYEMFARLADRLSVNIATYLIPRVANVMA